MGARGTLTLFANVFTEPSVMEVNRTSGRSPELHARRNECLTDRYYYYGKFTDKRYQAILNELSREFFLDSDITIPRLLDGNREYLLQLKGQNPDLAHFRKKWPHLVWPVATVVR